MIPQNSLINTDLELSNQFESSKTYKMSGKKIQGFTDDLEALRQCIYKELSTERYEYPIYSFKYGLEIEDLIGKDAAYVRAEFKRRIQECLLKDNRITSVDNFNFSETGDELFCEFYVGSIYGSLTMTKAVTL